MTKEFVTRDQAIGLKELGFNEPCLSVFRNHDPYFTGVISGYEEDIKDLPTNEILDAKFEANETTKNYWITRPSYHQAFRFFRENFKLFGEVSVIDIGNSDKKGYRFDWTTYDLTKVTGSSELLGYYSYEEAESACLDELIKLAKK